MSLQVTVNLYQLTMHFDGEQSGWSERLYLNAPATPYGLTTALQLVQYRLLCLPSTCSISWAKVTKVGNPRDARQVPLVYPQNGQWPGVSSGTPAVLDTNTLKPNRDNDAVILRLETQDGLWANRYFHGVPDVQVQADQLQNAITEATTAPPALAGLPGSTAWPVLVGYYMYLVQNNSVWHKSDESKDPPVQYYDTIASITVRKLGGRKTGRFFGQSVGRATR